MKTPFGSTLPLTESPFYSRISNNIDNGKNYYINAFNPGYALQASELNEVQELFFFNQNLTQRMNSNWMKRGYNVPFWEGCIPLDPNSIQITSSTTANSSSTFTVSLANGWYLWTEKTSKMSFWIYNDLADTSYTFTTTSGVGPSEYVGFTITSETIQCCQAGNCDTNQDDTLRDNSNGLADSYYTCGASRKKASFTDAVILNATTSSTFFPLFSVTLSNSTTSSFKFLDDQDVITN